VRRLSLLALVALPLASASAAPAPGRSAPTPAVARSLAAPPAKSCQQPGATFAGQGGAGQGQVATRVQKLGELPPANHYLAVVREVGGCPEPAVVRTGIRD